MLFDAAYAPPELAALFNDSVSALKQRGLSDEEAEKISFRVVQHAGWYKTQEGWTQLGPDIRNKVNIRHAELQPNGKYVVRDVDVFYPNAVKGGDGSSVYTPEKIRRRIENTNRSIQHGAPPPSISKGHPNPMQKMMGVELPSYGAAINFTESDKGEGWTKCDLINVDPTLVDEWKKGMWPGLSAGFVEDSDELNGRFGHIAVLGVESQALSALPATEIFQASSNVSAVYFSADPTSFSSKGKNMLTKKEVAKALRGAYAAVDTALASYEAGEPDADSKLSAAYEAKSAALKNFCNQQSYGESAAGGEGAMPMEHADADQDEKLVQEMLKADKGKEKPETEKFTATQEAQEETHVPEEGDLADKGGTGPTNQIEIPKGPDAGRPGNYNAEMTRAFAAQNKILEQLKQTVLQMDRDKQKAEFSAKLSELIAKGHQFAAADYLKQYDGLAGNKSALALLLKIAEKEPKRPSLANAGQTFSHSDANTAIESETIDQEVEALVRKYGGNGAQFAAASRAYDSVIKDVLARQPRN